MHENNGKPEALLWIDFETTGVDRRKSLPLEIGMECTDMLGEQKFGSLSRIIRPDRLDLLSMSPVAFSMHTDNGLLFELMGGSVRNDGMVVVANAVEEFLDSLSQRFSLVPAGTNVDFDLDFLRRLNLNPDAWLTYRKYDMATITELVYQINHTRGNFIGCDKLYDRSYLFCFSNKPCGKFFRGVCVKIMG